MPITHVLRLASQRAGVEFISEEGIIVGCDVIGQPENRAYCSVCDHGECQARNVEVA